MKIPSRSLAAGIVGILLVCSLCSSWSLAVRSSEPRVLHVGGLGPGNYTRIQDAVNASLDGDTVFVYHDSSPYPESITIPRSITLQGESRSTTVIEGGSRAIIVYADSVHISGFTITNVGDFWNCAGIYAISRDNRFDNLTIENNERMSGVYLDHASGTVIRDCLIQNNNYHGLRIEYSSNNLIINNTIRNVRGYGIYLANSPSNVIEGNTVQRVFEAGIALSEDSTSNQIFHNNLIDNPEQASDQAGGNNWSSPAGGNFYSDYTGVDQNHDGYGDTPYIIPGNFSEDPMPLMHPYGLVTPLYQVSLVGGFGISLQVHNIGATAGEHVNWTMTISGGLLLLPLHRTRGGVIASLAPDMDTIVRAAPFVLGAGKLSVTGVVGDQSYSGAGTLFLVYFVLRR